MPQDKENIEECVELSKLSRNFIGFDYNLVLQKDKLQQIRSLAEILNKNKFKMPFVYGKALIDRELDKQFCNNCDFRFFKSEFRDINDLLLDFPEEERLDFFKFANSLGCFSTDKVLDKNGKETKVILAQKATSVLSQLLKTEDMKLRKIPWTI